jgi:hypothetical protein
MRATRAAHLIPLPLYIVVMARKATITRKKEQQYFFVSQGKIV